MDYKPMNMGYKDIMKRCVKVTLERKRVWAQPPQTIYNYRAYTQHYVPGSDIPVPKYLKDRWIELALHAVTKHMKGANIIKHWPHGLVRRRKGTNVWETPIAVVVQK